VHFHLGLLLLLVIH